MDTHTPIPPVVAPEPILSKSYLDYYFYSPDPADNLLGNEFLCRKGILIIAGPSHVGKSSLAVQQDVLWALGKPAFGIQPARPLRILTIQAENDDSSMHRTTKSIIDSLKLSFNEIQTVGAATACITLRCSSGSEFLAILDKLLSLRPWFDIVRIDPLMAFIGDDPTNTKAVMTFMRSGLNQIIDRHNVAIICTHHTTKTPYIDTSKFNPHDFQYLMAGTADLTNLARAIIAIVPTKDGRTFAFVAAKGQSKIGWDSPVRYFAHGKTQICWEEATAPQTPPPVKTQPPSSDKVLTLFTADTELQKDDLISRCAIISIGQNTARDLISDLVKNGRLIQFEKPRPGARPEVWLKLPPPPAQTPPDDDSIPF